MHCVSVWRRDVQYGVVGRVCLRLGTYEVIAPVVKEESYFHRRRRAGPETLPEPITLRGRGVVLNHKTPPGRGFVIQLFSLVPWVITSTKLWPKQEKAGGVW